MSKLLANLAHVLVPPFTWQGTNARTVKPPSVSNTAGQSTTQPIPTKNEDQIKDTQINLGSSPSADAKMLVQKTIARNARFITTMWTGCMFALVLLTALAVGGYFLMSENIRQETSSAELVSRSGSLRVLSQRVALLVITIVSAPNAALQSQAENELRAVVSLMKEHRQALLAAPRSESNDEVHTLLFDGPDPLANRLEAYLNSTLDLLNETHTSAPLQNPHLLKVTTESTALLDGLGALTRAYRRAGEKGIFRLQRLAAWELGVSLIIFGVLGFFVFTPIIRRLRHELMFRSRVEQQLRFATSTLQDQTYRLTQSNKELDRFASVIAHDLRGPLANIINFGAFLTDFAGQKDPEVQDIASHIKASADRMDQMVRSLLDLSRATSSECRFEPTALNEIIDEVVADLQTLLSPIQASVEREDLPNINVDRVQIRQLFLNLLQNAIKYRDPSRPLRVKIQARVEEEEGAVEIVISDNGIGFPQSQADRIFEVYVQLHEGIKSDHDGQGLGLAICQRIVHRHGGRISAKGSPGRGAKFTIQLPMRVV